MYTSGNKAIGRHILFRLLPYTLLMYILSSITPIIGIWLDNFFNAALLHMTPEELSLGIEWINGDLKIEARFSTAGTSYVRILPMFPSTNLIVQLTLEVGHRIEILDLVGSGYYSGIQGQGYGRLAINTAIECLRLICPPETTVTGHISDMGDPDDSMARSECFIRRNNFWESTGFSLNQPHSPTTYMSAQLSDLRIRVTPSFGEDGLKHRQVPLSQFWTESSAPDLQPGDVTFLQNFDIDNIPEPPSQNELSIASKSAQQQLRICMISSWVTISLIFTASFKFYWTGDPLILLLVLTLSVACSYPLATFLVGVISNRLTSLRILINLQRRLHEAVMARVSLIQAVEKRRVRFAKRGISFLHSSSIGIPEERKWMIDFDGDLLEEGQTLLDEKSNITGCCDTAISRSSEYFSLIRDLKRAIKN